MEIHIDVILEVDDAELDAPGARAAAPAAARSAVQNALERHLGGAAKVAFVRATESGA